MRRAVSTVILLLVSAAVAAGPRERLTEGDALLCDPENQACLRGSITYYSNPRLVELRSRVQSATGPGLLVFHLVGENSLGHVRRTALEVQIRGRYSEIVNSKMITDHPDVDSWSLEAIAFVPGPPPDSEYR